VNGKTLPFFMPANAKVQDWILDDGSLVVQYDRGKPQGTHVFDTGNGQFDVTYNGNMIEGPPPSTWSRCSRPITSTRSRPPGTWPRTRQIPNLRTFPTGPPAPQQAYHRRSVL